MLPVTRSIDRQWKKSQLRFIKRAFFSDNVHDPSVMLREVMRNVAQPVAIAVTSIPPTSSLYGKAPYHGATLTSFTSLTLHPHPLVAFSLRLPSRMADCLRPWRTHNDHQAASLHGNRNHRYRENTWNEEEFLYPNQSNSGMKLPPKSELPWPLSKLPMPEQPPEWAQSLFSRIPNSLISQDAIPSFSSSSSSDNPLKSHSSNAVSLPRDPSSSVETTTPVIQPHPTPLTISLLSKSNEGIADSLSLPQTDHSSIFSFPETWSEHMTHPPSLVGSLGSLQCEVVGSVLLKDLCGSAEGTGEGEGSEMFICRVIGVDMPSEQESKDREPLLHWRRKYVGIKEGS
ncbi:uncharacterized protein IL334_005976 [Kwoniella shivajii]|uniref:Flavin reductase like domain-containing protein n=1 Tax=Kwoniella shivajii TaxID=564305 RepID=A0ABZ1D4M4_9TREE|nr:hypothetical protein IL334_005976 [Kwoniella shivajii]